MNEQFFDISSVLPWLLIGAFAATVLWTLLHWLFGSKRKLTAEIAGLRAQLATEQRDLAASQSTHAKLLADNEHWQTALAESTSEASKRGIMLNALTSQQDTFKTQLNESLSTTSMLQQDVQHFQAALADATKRAASLAGTADASASKLAQAQAQIDAQAQALAQSQTKIQSLTSAPPPAPAAVASPDAIKAGELALATLRRDLDTRFVQIKNLEEDVSRLTGENAFLKKDKAISAEELTKLKAEAAAAAGAHAKLAEITTHRDALAIEMEQRARTAPALQSDELKKQKDEIATLRSALDAKTRQAIEEAEAHTKHAASHGPELQKHKDEIAALKGALDAKNRQAVEQAEELHNLKSARHAAVSTAEPGVSMPAIAHAAVKPEAPRAADMADLKRIQGIGVLLEKRLYSMGVTSIAQIANWTEAEVDAVGGAFDIRGRIHREQWVEQARILADGGETKFSSQHGQGGA